MTDMSLRFRLKLLKVLTYLSLKSSLKAEYETKQHGEKM